MVSSRYYSWLTASFCAHIALLFGSLSWDPPQTSKFSSLLNSPENHYSLKVQMNKVQRKKELKPTKIEPVKQNSTTKTHKLLVEKEVSQSQQINSTVLQESFLGELHREIENQKFYPSLSRRLGQQGTVVVAFTLTADGHIINHKVLHPCPYHRLNQAALESVQKITHFKPIPNELNLDTMDVSVPIEFKLL